jgi:hypothetical protein
MNQKQREWTPEAHECRILSRLANGPLTLKGVLGGLAHWWKRGDCVDALKRLLERGDIVEFEGPRRRYFALRETKHAR